MQPQNCVDRTYGAKHTILDICGWDMATKIGNLVSVPGTLMLIESGSALAWSGIRVHGCKGCK